MKLLDFLTQFEGIIGALLGVIVTMLMGYLLKKMGKIRMSSSNHWLSVLESEEDGTHYYIIANEAKKKINEYSSGLYEFDLTVFNSSDEPKGLKDITICFVGPNKSNIVKKVPRDEATRRISAGAIRTDEVKILNLPVKEMINYHLLVYIEREDLMHIHNCKEVILTATDHKDKKLKWILKES